MSYWFPMLDKPPYLIVGVYPTVIIDFRGKPLNLMAVKTLKLNWKPLNLMAVKTLKNNLKIRLNVNQS